MNSPESRETFVDAIKEVADVPFEETEGEVGFWRLAQGPVCLGGLGAICLYLGIDGLISGEQIADAISKVEEAESKI